MQTEAVIVTDKLTKRYGDTLAVDALDLQVRRGEIYGFLGRNGAGKTTTIRMILGLVRPTSGEFTVNGKAGFLVETATAYPNLTVRENLDIQRRLTASPPSAVADAIELMELGKYSDQRAGALSLGNKQRLSLARAMLHKPDLLILDEPANALDPSGIVEVRNLLRSLATDQGVTVFLSSHILAEVAHIADRIGIIHEGRLLEELDPETIVETGRSCIEVKTSDLDRTKKVLKDAGIDFEEQPQTNEDLERHFLRLTGGGR